MESSTHNMLLRRVLASAAKPAYRRQAILSDGIDCFVVPPRKDTVAKR